ncbi:MAG: methionyl-tRNA formyltransferase [Mycobacteriales bacterium]|nr:methionyl-tRNA formyltransferase [Frankia sp.]
MRAVFAGTPDAAVPALIALLASRHEVAAVVTRPPAAAGRGRQLRASAVAEVAAANGVPILTPARARDPELLAQLRELAPDVCPVVAYGQLIPPALLAVPAHGWVNLHFSLLPAWRGAAPVQHAILHGDEVTGATTFLLEEGLDTGPVLGVVTEVIRPRDTAADLLARLAASGARLLVATLDGLEDGSLVAVPQPRDGISLAPKVTVDDARVDWTAPAIHLDRRIRAMTPAPGAWTTFRRDRLKIGPVVPVDAGDPLPPGQVRAADGALLVGTATSPVALSTVQPPGRAAMPAVDWARGARLTADEALG